jgi:hypothetical protein
MVLTMVIIESVASCIYFRVYRAYFCNYLGTLKTYLRFCYYIDIY